MAITIKTDQISQLRKKLAYERKLLEDRERAIAMVEQMLLEDSGQGSLPLPGIAPEKRHGLQKNVKHVIEQLGNSEFTVADIEKRFKDWGLLLPKKNPKSRIAMVLQTLRERDEIVRTSAEPGAPHRYKVA